MRTRKSKKLFKLATQLWAEEKKKNGCLSATFCWIEDAKTGEFLVYTRIPNEATLIKEALLIEEEK